jgi:hypothetical protein
MGLHGLLPEMALRFYTYKIFIPHSEPIQVSTACYGDSFTFLYVNDDCTSQERHACLYSLIRGLL